MELADIQLMLRVRDGDVEAFREIATRYREPLRRYFASLIADRSQADDFAQETLLRLWASRERYEPSGKFSAYLFQIGTRCWLNERRKFETECRAAQDDAIELSPAAPATEPESIALERLRRARIRRAVAALPAAYREVFSLCHEDGMRYAEIAARLQIPVGTVKSRMAEALKRLRRALSPREEL
ncbi:MAG TPA: RNA polymerase sigma factor [Chthonomonadaceae bacterium]|nr:RNA polymerase sigma factor [Chthonomonadaceae bacterium]